MTTYRVMRLEGGDVLVHGPGGFQVRIYVPLVEQNTDTASYARMLRSLADRIEACPQLAVAS